MNIQNLSRYLFEIENTLIPELKSELTPDNKREFKEWKKSIGTNNYWKWYDENINEIAKYVKATPNQRLKLKKWNADSLTKCQYIISSIHFLENSILYLDTYQFFMYQHQNKAYRETACNAGLSMFENKTRKTKFYLC